MNINTIDNDRIILQAIREIEGSYGDKVSIFKKRKSLRKFGRNTDLGLTREIVWLRGGYETYPTGNTIDRLSSSNSSDNQEVKIEGHILSGNDLVFKVQTITLNGQNEVTLPTPLYRSTRVFNNDSSDFAGTIYVYESGGSVSSGVPQDTSKIHLQTDGTNNQSLKCSTSLSHKDYWIITSGLFSVNRQQARSVDFSLEIREYNKVFRTKETISVSSSGGSSLVKFDPAIIIPKNSDMRITAASSGTGTQVDSTISGYLASIIE